MIADVLQGVRADDEVDFLRAEGIGPVVTDVPADPGVAVEVLPVAALGRKAVKTACVERFVIHHVVGAVEGPGPAADVEHDVVGP